jgi:hypothetical protein
MSKESLTWLNSQTLIGFTTKRGTCAVPKRPTGGARNRVREDRRRVGACAAQ